jgi:hypothetical protein
MGLLFLVWSSFPRIEKERLVRAAAGAGGPARHTGGKVDR